MDLRNEFKDAFFEKHNVKLGFMSAFVKASAAALSDMPIINASSFFLLLLLLLLLFIKLIHSFNHSYHFCHIIN